MFGHKRIPTREGGVEIVDLSFSYVPEKPLIRNFNLSVKPGQRIAIVGPTGCGKTTFINLIMRFYDPNEGQILLDGSLEELKSRNSKVRTLTVTYSGGAFPVREGIQLVKDSGYPGMKVLEFAFDSRDSGCAEDYLPHNYEKNSVVYTGTHDNETVTGWFTAGLKPEEKEAVRDYFCDHTTPDAGMYMPLVCAAMRSVSRLCIIPMQDLLGLGNEARMNTPSTYGNNWKWRLLKDEFGEKEVKTLYEITKRYGRIGK